jgi:hypothetical protein
VLVDDVELDAGFSHPVAYARIAVLVTHERTIVLFKGLKSVRLQKIAKITPPDLGGVILVGQSIRS